MIHHHRDVLKRAAVERVPWLRKTHGSAGSAFPSAH